MIRMIAAVSQNGVIGCDNKIPWMTDDGVSKYPEDMKHFRRMTKDSVVIMGKKTFESIGFPLPNRDNIVITSQELSVVGIETFPSITAALLDQSIKSNGRQWGKDIWFIGGASIYQEAMQHVEEVWLTITPDHIEHPQAVRFPWLNPTEFSIKTLQPFAKDERLELCVYSKH